MKILFDQGVPVPLRKVISDHEVITAYEKGWSVLKNGELIMASESSGFDLLITTDQKLRYQQNLKNRKIGIIVILSTSWPRIQKKTDRILQAIKDFKPGMYVEIPIIDPA